MGQSYFSGHRSAWTGTDEQLAHLIMPMYFIKNVVVNSEDITLAKNGWDLLLSGNLPAYIESRSNASDDARDVLPWFSKILYDRLFDVNPISRSLFKDDNKVQVRVISAIIAYALSQLKNPQKFRITMARIGTSHMKMGVTPMQFGIIGDVLFWSLSFAMRALWTAELRFAWVKIFS